MTPEPRPDFAAQCAGFCPGFRAIGRPRRARKSEVLAGELDGMPVIAKRLLGDNAVWSWYLAREIEIYRAFAASPPPLRVPRFVAASEDVLVIERLTGGEVAKLRRPHAELSAESVHALVAMHDAIATWAGQFPTLHADAKIRLQLRSRLLEDPTDPRWIEWGIARCVSQGILDRDTVARALDALQAYGPIAASHGDLLLRNVMFGSPGGELALIDWECAGPHVADWDLALLWTQLAASARGTLDTAIGGGPRRRAFDALVVYALAREVTFLRAFRTSPAHPAMTRVASELAEACARLAEGSSVR